MGKGKKVALLVLPLSLLWSLKAYGDYIATGQFKGFFCKGFVVHSCDFKAVNRVKKGGRLYTIKNIYKSVSSYDSKTKYCKIRVKGNSAWSFLTDKPEFYYFKENLGTPESIGFPCEKS